MDKQQNHDDKQVQQPDAGAQPQIIDQTQQPPAADDDRDSPAVGDGDDWLPPVDVDQGGGGEDPLAVFREEGLIGDDVKTAAEAVRQIRDRMTMEAIADFINALPADRAIPFLAAVGAEDYDQFRALLANDPVDVVRSYYRARGLGEGEVESLIATLTDEGKLEETANKAIAEVKAVFDQRVRELAEERKKQRQRATYTPEKVIKELMKTPSEEHIKKLPYKDGVKQMLARMGTDQIIDRIVDAMSHEETAAQLMAIMAYYDPRQKAFMMDRLVRALDSGGGPAATARRPQGGKRRSGDTPMTPASPEEILKAFLGK